MTKAYELADGSLSTDYEVGDEFVVAAGGNRNFSTGSVIEFYNDDKSSCPLFKLINGETLFCLAGKNDGAYFSWHKIKPTPETKRKAHARKVKLTINKGDFISAEIDLKYIIEFCHLANSSGHRGGILHKMVGSRHIVGVSINDHPLRDMTIAIKRYVDMKQKFTKSDLKDGMRCIDREGDAWYVCGEYLCHKGGARTVNAFQHVSKWSDEFKHKLSSHSIIKIIDRDDTVVWECDEEPRELTIEEIAKVFNLPPERIRIKK